MPARAIIGPAVTSWPASSPRTWATYWRMIAIGRSGRPTDAQNFGPYPPVPTPSTNRPPDSWARVAACAARPSGVHIRAAGTTEIPVRSEVS